MKDYVFLCFANLNFGARLPIDKSQLRYLIRCVNLIII